MCERQIVTEIIRGNQRKRNSSILSPALESRKNNSSKAYCGQWQGEVLSFSADSPILLGAEWIQFNWERARRLAGSQQEGTEVLLVLDEVQKVSGWSEVVKLLWDEAEKRDTAMQVLLLGSSSLLLQKCVTESLTGCFFLYHCTHWQY